jgi:hypothetical protein
VKSTWWAVGGRQQLTRYPGSVYLSFIGGNLAANVAV